MERTSTLARFEVSGEILTEDTLALLSVPKCKLSGAEMVEDDFIAAYDLLSEQWQRIRNEVGEYDTEKLRKRWLLEVLSLLDHDPKSLRSHTSFGQRLSIPLTHRAGDVPVWLLGYGQNPDEKPEEGKRRRSPHDLFQEYLDLTSDEWGIIFSGKTIRLLHDYHKSLTRNYVEADLESIFDALDVDAFRVVWRVFHASRFVQDKNGEVPLEKLRDFSREDGVSVGKELRFQVRNAIEVLGNGFLASDSDGTLTKALQSDPAAIGLYYQSLLRIVYRMMFLLYVENRPNWTPAHNPIWIESYSITRLREMSEETSRPRAEGYDLWEGLKISFGLTWDGNDYFGIHPYGGELFDDTKLWMIGNAALPNSCLLSAVRLLTIFERDKQPYRVNFRYLDIEALGSVYEGLLDATAILTDDGKFAFAPGTERKLTGSYYTPKELVAELIQTALVPVIEDRLQGKTGKGELEKALLSIKVVDPACGSGAFLVQALDKLTEKLVEIRLMGEEPSDLDIREARRDVVRNCIHGVDFNPLAVDLCRFVLWLNVAHPRFPLSYLEPLIKCGNSLVGVPLPSQVERRKQELDAEKQRLLDVGDRRAAAKIAYVGWNESIPDEAFEPVFGDDPKVSKGAKRQDQEQRSGQLTMEAALSAESPEALAEFYGELRNASDATIVGIRHAEGLYSDYLASSDYLHHRQLADMWCASFFWRYVSGGMLNLTHQWLRAASQDPAVVPEEIWAEVERLRHSIRFFHWHLEFPDVFSSGGFDCVLGNPPWERPEFHDKDFWSDDPYVSQARNKSDLANRIKEYRDGTDEHRLALVRAYDDARHQSAAENRFVRACARFPLTAMGKFNLYALFAELALNLICDDGRAGIIVQSGIATDDTTKTFFGFLSQNQRLAGMFDFENREKLFPEIDSRMKFCLLSVAGKPIDQAKFAFFLTKTAHLGDALRQFHLRADDIHLLNPNTRTCPIFRTLLDMQVTSGIYQRIPVFVDDGSRRNSWLVSPVRVFNMGVPEVIGKARTAGQLLEGEYQPCASNHFQRLDTEYLPVIESKLVHQYNHRFATYLDCSQADLDNGQPREMDIGSLSDPSVFVKPRYWLPAGSFPASMKGLADRKWFIVYRNFARATDERTMIATIIPLSATDFPLRVLLTQKPPCEQGILLANLNSLVFDYVVRQKVGSTDMSTFILKQLPVLPPGSYDDGHRLFIVPRVLELLYTAWDMKAVADDIWRDSDSALQEAIIKHWEQASLDGAVCAESPPPWIGTVSDGIPAVPFRWTQPRRAERRAELDAYYARLYGLTRKQLRYILDPQGLSSRELEDILDPWEDPTCSGAHLMPEEPATDFPGETFRVLKKNDEAAHDDDYYTRRLVLDAWERLEAEYGRAEPVNYRRVLADREASGG